MATLALKWLGKTDFSEAHAAQEQRRRSVLQGTASEAFWMTEHFPVLTAGMRQVPEKDLPDPEWLKDRNLKVIKTRRGGLLTYHGPGQLMGYLIMDVKARGMSIPCLVWAIEAGIINWLGKQGVGAGRKAGAPGVWVGDHKICSIGLHFKKWVSIQGFALNLSPDLSIFGNINPCGFSGQYVTSVQHICGYSMRPEEAYNEVSDEILATIRAKTVDR